MRSKDNGLFANRMRFVKQKQQLPVSNLDKIIKGSGKIQKRKKHGPLLPNSVRCIISGPSNCGKTNVLINLIGQPEGLEFENIYIFSKSLYQDKYQILEKAVPKEVGYYKYDDNDLVPKPSDAKTNSVMVFDDVSCEKHNNIRDYFTMGRHKSIDTFYLGQTYSKIPKQLIRDNANLIILFKQDDTNLRHIYNDHVTTDMTFDEFKELCAKAWSEPHGFCVISKESDINKGRYRVKFDSFVRLS